MKTLTSSLLIIFIINIACAQHFTTYTNTHNFLAIAIDSAGNKWFGTNGGLLKFDGSKWTKYTTSDGLIQNQVTALIFDKKGVLWCGTNGGISKFDGNKWTTLLNKNNIANFGITSEVIDKQGTVWFGTMQERGLAKYDGVNWKTYTEDSGLVEDNVKSVAVDARAYCGLVHQAVYRHLTARNGQHIINPVVWWATGLMILLLIRRIIFGLVRTVVFLNLTVQTGQIISCIICPVCTVKFRNTTVRTKPKIILLINNNIINPVATKPLDLLYVVHFLPSNVHTPLDVPIHNKPFASTTTDLTLSSTRPLSSVYVFGLHHRILPVPFPAWFQTTQCLAYQSPHW